MGGFISLDLCCSCCRGIKSCKEGKELIRISLVYWGSGTLLASWRLLPRHASTPKIHTCGQTICISHCNFFGAHSLPGTAGASSSPSHGPPLPYPPPSPTLLSSEEPMRRMWRGELCRWLLRSAVLTRTLAVDTSFKNQQRKQTQFPALLFVKREDEISILKCSSL